MVKLLSWFGARTSNQAKDKQDEERLRQAQQQARQQVLSGQLTQQQARDNVLSSSSSTTQPVARTAPALPVKKFQNPQIEQAAANLRAGKLSTEAFGNYVNSLGPQKTAENNLPNTPIQRAVGLTKTVAKAAVDTGRSIPAGFVNTAQLPYDVARQASAVLTKNGKALDNASKAITSDAVGSLYGPVASLTQQNVARVMSPIALSKANQQEAYANKVLGKAYAPFKGGQNQASIEASQSKLDILKQNLAQGNLGYSDTTKNNFIKAIPATVAGVANAIAAGKAPGSDLKTKALLSSLLMGTAGAAQTAAQADKASGMDFIKNTSTNAAMGLALPVVSRYGEQAVVNTLRNAGIAPPSRLNMNEVADLKAFHDQARTGAITDPMVYKNGLAAAQKAGIDYRNPTAVDGLIKSHQTYEVKKQQVLQNLYDAKAKADNFAQKHGVGLSTGAVNENGIRIGLNGKPLVEPLPGQTEIPLGDVKRFRATIEAKSSQTKIPVKILDSEGYRKIENKPSSMSKAEWEALYKTAPAGTEMNLKVKQPNTESNIPVRKLTREGDVVTATNVNPNIKAGEKRFAVDANTGDLIPDKKGAYSLFTDKDGRVTGLRVGKETFGAKDIGDLSTVNGYGSTLATIRRNVERGFDKPTAEKVSAFLVDDQQHRATQMIERQLSLKQGLREQADNLGISFGKNSREAKKVSAAIQNFGEKIVDKEQLVKEFGAEKANKIIQADAWFKSQYNSLLDEMNGTLTQFGYDPVPKRANYYTHFQDNNLWKSFGLKMDEIRSLAGPTLQDASPNAARGNISNKLAGESEFTQPNKRFNKYALRREGDTHTADAFQAFERYIDPTLNNIYMTPSIARARVLTKAIAQDADIVGKDANHIIVQTKEWANNLAGKSNRFDRPLIDTKGGAMALKASQWVQRKAGANTIVGNLSTAVMQPILLAQTAGKSGYKNTLLALMQEMSTAHGADAPIRQSEFMRRRYADLSKVTDGAKENVAKVLNKPLEIVEETAARVSWNAAHNDALSQGLSGKQAIKYADVQAEKSLAGRSIGERPELYTSKAAAPITMYQLEVNNFWQQMGKEMTKTQAAKTLVAAYGLNLMLQGLTGKQVGFNPIDTAIKSYQETQKDDKSAGDKAKAVAQMWGGEFVDNIPLVGPGLNLAIGDKNMKKVFGPSTNVGRYGIGSPLSAIATTTKIGGVPVPLNAILPYGGGQVRKIITGAEALVNGKLSDKNGKTLVDIPKTPSNIVKGLSFGPSAIPEVGAYYDNTGKKKVDQTVIPNQGSSNASNQGSSSNRADDRKSMIEAGFTTPEAKKFLALSDEDKKFYQNEPEYKGLYKQYQSVKKAFSAGDTYDPAVPQEAADTLDKIARLSASGKKNYFKNNPEEELNYEYAKYQKDSAEGSLTYAQDFKRKRDLAKLEVGIKFDPETRDIGTLSKADVYNYITKNQNGKKIAEQLLAYNDELLAKGLITDHPYRDKYGNVNIKPKTASGGKGKKASLSLVKTALSIPKTGKINTPRLAVAKTSAPNYRKARKAIPKIGKTPSKLVVTRTKTA